MQLKASFFLEGIKSQLTTHFQGKVLAENGHDYQANWRGVLDAADEPTNEQLQTALNSKLLQFEGMKNWLSWFHINKPFTTPETPNSLLAVLNNLVSRGEFTKPSLLIEQRFSEVFARTQIVENETAGSINTVLLPEHAVESFFDAVWTSLHIIDTTPGVDEPDRIYLGDPNSSFETWFLSNALTNDKCFIRQLLQQQRALVTIALPEHHRGFKGARVDFSMECPYYFDEKVKVFCGHKDYPIQRRKGVIVEIDGAPYHTFAPQIIHDRKRDEAVRLAHWKVERVTTENRDALALESVARLMGTSFVSETSKNFDLEDRLTFTQLALSPIAIARVQKTILRYLISLGRAFEAKRHFHVAVVERDVPCGHLAVEDLNEQLSKLFELKGEQWTPQIEVTVFNESFYQNSPLHGGDVIGFDDLNIDDNGFDLIIDHAILRRHDVFLDDERFDSKKTYILRSVHYVEQSHEPILCARPIRYQELVQLNDDGSYHEHEGPKAFIEYFLRNIFRKRGFRLGQLPILSRALQLKSVIGLLPTGGGKSLTYQIAALLQPGVTLVIDPIKSLMVDQYRNLHKAGIENGGFINSTLSTGERRMEMARLYRGERQFSFVSPERLVIQEFRDLLQSSRQQGVFFAYCVIDEVHCVSEWGHDFRTPYLSLAKNARRYCPILLPSEANEEVYRLPLFGLTATASFDVLADVERELEILDNEADDTIVSFENTLREEIQYCVLETDVALDTQLGLKLGPQLQKPNPAGRPIDVKEDRVFQSAVGEEKQSKIIHILQDDFLKTYHFYRNEENIEQILQRTFDEFLDQRQRDAYSNDFLFYRDSVVGRLGMEVELHPDNLWEANANGFLVFVPHRSHVFGVTDRFKTDNQGSPPPRVLWKGVYDRLESVGYAGGFFMGSGDDMDEDIQKAVQIESMKFQEAFINNEITVMVATKAFGMGIDKPNIRATIHMNMPSSLESFVQESGRVSRDGKLGISFLLFNQQIFNYFTGRAFRNLYSGNTRHGFNRSNVRIPDFQVCRNLQTVLNNNGIKTDLRYEQHHFNDQLTLMADSILDEQLAAYSGDALTNREKLRHAAKEQWVDFDLLEYFHYNSFKGAIKELVILHELLYEIAAKDGLILDKIAQEFSEKERVNYSLRFGGGGFAAFLWLNDRDAGYGLGYINTTTSRVHVGGEAEAAYAMPILERLKDFIVTKGREEGQVGFAQLANWLHTVIPAPNAEGIINHFENGMATLHLGVQNRFSEKKDKKGSFISNTEWLKQMVQTLKDPFRGFANLTDTQVKTKLLDSQIIANDPFHPVESVEDLWENIEKFHQQQGVQNLQRNVQAELKLATAFYRDRVSSDTYKAIYRLMSVGLVTDYTINYRTKTVALELDTQLSNHQLYENLRKYIRRYHSEAQTAARMASLDDQLHEDFGAFAYKVLKVLVEFVYKETEEKRFEGIKEMVEAIRTGLPQPGETYLEGNMRFREEIYYYFNAKYARRRYLMPDGTEASLVIDTDSGIESNYGICAKYFKVIRNDAGAGLSNLKHLRGATQKLLRANPNNACLRILKGFALYLLSHTQAHYLNEAKSLLKQGFKVMFIESQWSLAEFSDAIAVFETELNAHYNDHNHQNDWILCREMLYLQHHNWWLTQTLEHLQHY